MEINPETVTAQLEYLHSNFASKSCNNLKRNKKKLVKEQKYSECQKESCKMEMLRASNLFNKEQQ